MLEARMFAVNVAPDGESGLELLQRQVHDAAIVDVGLPGIDGFEVVRRARRDELRLPILILSARDGIEDRIRGFESGADDYLVKPFAEDELIARVSALLRRSPDRGDASAIVVGRLHVDVAGCTASYAGVPLTLGPTEFRLLEYLARNAGLTLSRAQILERLREDRGGSSNVVDVFVSQLRSKLRRCGGDGIIETIWNVGYRLRP